MSRSSGHPYQKHPFDVSKLGPLKRTKLTYIITPNRLWGCNVTTSPWSRRRFLQAAAVGAFGGAAGFALPRSVGEYLSKTGITPQTAILSSMQYRIFEGVVEQVGASTVDLAVNGSVHRINVAPDASIWRGQYGALSQLQQGDDLLVRLNQNLDIQYGWSNLSRIKGLLKSRNGNSLSVQPLHGSGPNLPIEIGQSTRFGDNASTATGTAPPMDNRTYIDAIGLTQGGVLLATLLSATPASGDGSAPGSVHQATLTDEGGVDAELLSGNTYKGYATYFYCGNNAGACGTCNTGKSNQLAWPALSACGCCTGSCCDCSAGCNNQDYLSCGNSVTVTDLSCGSNSQACSIVDCGPCQNGGTGYCSACSVDLCSRSCTLCGATGTSVVVDLTYPTFAAFYDPSSVGCFPCKVAD
jgi:hypothetical protein